MFFRIVIFLLFLSGAYASYEIIRISLIYRDVYDAAPMLVRGPENAADTMVEFMDYTCEWCRKIQPAVDKVLQARPDIRFIARPIPTASEDGERVARLVLAAGLQDKFWEAHRLFLSHEGSFDEIFIRHASQSLQLDYDRWIQDSTEKITGDILADNLEAAERIGIHATPAFMINRIFYVPRDSMPTAIDFLRMLEAR